MSDSGCRNETEMPFGSIAGKKSVDVECLTPRAEPELCDGWTAEVDLDDPARVEGGRLVLPGFGGECPECGNGTFRVDGVEVMFRV